MTKTKKTRIDRFARFATANRWLVLLLTLVLASVLGAGTFRIKGEVKLEELVPYEHPYLKIIAKFAEVFGTGGGGVVLSLKAKEGEVFKEEILAQVIRMTDEIALWEETYRVLTLSIGARSVKVARATTGGSIEAETLMWPDSPHSDAGIEQLKKDIFSSPAIRGLVARDGSATVVVTEFKQEVPYERCFELLHQLEKDYTNEDVTVQMAGFPVLMGWIYSYGPQIMMVMIVSVALMVLVLYLIYRNFIGMAAPLCFGTISTAMGLGFIGWTGINFSPLLYVLAFLVAARMVSHAVQITHRYMEEYVETHNREEACQRTIRSMVLPNWAGVTTDAAGFLVLILVKIGLMQEVAVFMTFWMLSVALCGVVTPIICSFMPLKRAAEAWVEKSRRVSLLDRVCVGLARFSIGPRRWAVVALVVLALAFCAYQASNLKIGDPSPGSPLLWPDHPYNQAIKEMNKTFDLSAESLVLYFEGEERAVWDPQVFRTFEAFDRHMRLTLPDIYKSTDSFTSLMKTVNMLMFDADVVRYELPDTRDQVRGLFGWARQNTDIYTVRRYFDEKWGKAQTTLFFSDHTSDNLLRIRDAAYNFFEKYPREVETGEFVLAGGTLGMEIAVNEEMKRTHLMIDGMVLGMIFLLCTLFYRSLVAGLMFTLPLILGNLTAFAYMGVNNIGLSINTLPVAAVGVGVGVDFAIYIYNRCMEEFPARSEWGRTSEDERWRSAILQAVRTSGKAVVFTGLTMVLPIMVWWFISDLKFQAQMGMFLGMILTTNVILALTLHPLLLYVIRPKFIVRRRLAEAT